MSEEKDGWQDIENAPKDGKPVLGFCWGVYMEPIVWDGWRKNRDWVPFFRLGHSLPRPPTHWMPLPAPPGKASPSLTHEIIHPREEYKGE